MKPVHKYIKQMPSDIEKLIKLKSFYIKRKILIELLIEVKGKTLNLKKELSGLKKIIKIINLKLKERLKMQDLKITFKFRNGCPLKKLNQVLNILELDKIINDCKQTGSCGYTFSDDNLIIHAEKTKAGHYIVYIFEFKE